MKVENMQNNSGRAIPNQFIIEDEGRGALGNFLSRRVFQSYESVIVKITTWPDKTEV